MHRSEAEGRFGEAEPVGRASVCARATRIGVLHLAAGKPTESSLRPRGWMYSPEIREPRQRKRQTAAISPTYGDDNQSGQDKSPCSTHLHHRKTNFTFVCFQNVRLLLGGAQLSATRTNPYALTLPISRSTSHLYHNPCQKCHIQPARPSRNPSRRT